MGNDDITLSEMNIQWHPAFCAAAELEFIANKGELDFQREYNLSRKPLQIDLLVIEKLDDVVIENEIGRIFRKYNVIEYKSPDDGMTIDDFFKTVAYADLYKSQGKNVDQIPIDKLTVSLVREGKSEALFRSLEKYGFSVEREFAGIYYVHGFHLPAQIVVTRELEGDKHRSLRVLSRNAAAEDARAFVEDAQKLTEQGDRLNVDAILQVSVSANLSLYNELKWRYPEMCEAMRILMKDEIREEITKAQKAGEAAGEARGEARGKAIGEAAGEARGEMKKARETAFELAGMGLSIEKIAQAVKVNLDTVREWLSGTPTIVR